MRTPLCILMTLPLVAVAAPPASVNESARRIPVAASVDVVVAGGTVAGVAAALEAAAQGRSVYLVSPRLYLGDDMVDTLQLWLEEGEKPTGALTERIFAKPGPASPLRVKQSLERALVNAGVRFLFGSYTTDPLVDESGRPAGVVVANRAGRQAIIARTVVDATEDAGLARRLGAAFRPSSGDRIETRRVVLGGQPPQPEAIRRRIPAPEEKQNYYEYSMTFSWPDRKWSSTVEAEHAARDRTYQPGQMRSSARLWFVPPDRIVGRRPAREWLGAARASIGHFQPRGVDRLFVAGANADVDDAAARELMRPVAGERIGRLIGVEAARLAASLPSPRNPRVSAPTGGSALGEIRESLNQQRSTGGPATWVSSPARMLPVLGEYDVVVVGGGTAGAAAAIGAARRGARVLVAEYQEGLGGTGTLGLIGKPYHGRDAGFAKEVPFPTEQFTVDDKMEWYRREIRKARGEIWFGVLGAGALVEGGRVRGAVLVTPRERGVALAKVVIDATGNADVAVTAGARSMSGGDAIDLAMQGAGLPQRRPDSTYVNTDYLLVDENDMLDVLSAVVGARMTMPDTAYDSGALLQTRERRRVVGDFVLSYLDQIAGRRYPDSIVLSSSDYDSHGYPSDDFFALLPHNQFSRQANHPAPGGMAYTPYRCLLPRGLEGILVVGLGISMQRDASAIVRMQRDIANQGYAAGVASAMTAASAQPLRALDVRALQRHLIDIGALPPDVVEHQDSFPLPDTEIRRAAQNIAYATNPEEAGPWLAVLLSHRKAALPLLASAYASANPRHKLVYARLLGFFGDKSVVPVLAAALDGIKEWDARILQGKMAEYAYLPTPIDTLILALGKTRDAGALPALLRKLDTLDASVTLSHHRALAMALEEIGDPRAAGHLARLLAKPGMRGHVMRKLEPLHNDEDKRRRLGPLREITIARALYRCGDYQNLGQQILREYRSDVRGLFERHATAVLQSPAAPATPGR